MTPRARVGLLFGGASVEHEVSVVSARGVAGALDPARYDVVPVAIAEDGRWLAPAASAAILASGASRAQADGDAGLVVDPGAGGLLATANGHAPSRLQLDVIFSVVHGWGGEDGRIQGLLDLAGIPCVGSGVLGSAVGMDKQVAKALFQERGLPVGPWRSLLRSAWSADRETEERRLAEALGFPMFVKPANGGSSVGISKVRDAKALPEALEAGFEHDRKVVVEKGLDVREIECAVLGNDRTEVSICGEIVPAGEFYDYASKYQDGSSRLLIPAPLAPEIGERIRALAQEAFGALDLAGMARVDFFLERGSDRILINEVNTLPGFTPISMYPKLWEASGLSYRDLLTKLIDLARARHAEERMRRTRRDG
ncbi:MAG TPA: D-alanine--D-alanine ligase family protein [Candidatus Polarisedimenticolaceae bacterium]|nr:D-alanine--D-alanine ligase family protein [Candidatus Polarisedimenticolaceae bacterium]